MCVVFTETGTDEEEQEKLAPVTYVNNIMHPMFSNVEVYNNNQQIYNSNGLYAQKSCISTKIKAAISEYKRVWHLEAMTMNRVLRILLTTYQIPFLQGE